MANSDKWIITLTVMIGTIMAALDSSIVNVALPYMRGTLGASVEEITWVATGYILSSVIMMPIVGMLSARYGRKNFYLFSIVSFTLSSMLCGIAWDLTSMVVFRLVQGIGGGVLIPVSQAILRETYPPDEQGKAMGLFGFGVVLGPAFGPTLGGWLTDHYSWPWIFYINVPIGVVNILMVMRYIKDPPYLVREKGKIDLLGLGLMTLGLGGLQIMLERGEREAWFESDMIRVLLFVSLTALVLFIWRELTCERPAVDLRMLKDVNFASGSFIGGLLGMGLFGSLFLLPMFLQQLLGYPALDSGLALMPRSLAMAVAMPIGGRVYNKVGPRVLIGSGLIVTAAAFYQLSRLSLNVGYLDVFIPQFLQGVGFGLIFVALSTAALSTIEKQNITAAAGLYNVVRQVFASVGIAIAASQLTKATTSYHALLSEKITEYSEVGSRWIGTVASGMRGQGIDAFSARQMALSLLDGEVSRQAGMMAYNYLYLLVTFLFIISLPFIFFLKSNKKRERADEIIVE
ncbi:MAG TPA: MDR family MFS transporter [Nitrospirota bacterium]|nr:MDR family MFS transporter [Nitrospirota bacterium]